MQKLLLPLLAVGALSVSTAGAQTLISDTFGSSFSNFTAQGTPGTPPASFQWSNSIGVGGVSGRIDSISGSQNHVNNVRYVGSGAAVTWTAGQQYGTSIFFLPGTIATGNVFQVQNGFLRSDGSQFGGGGSSVWGQVRQDSSGSPFLRLFQHQTQVGSNSATFTLSNALWYELETTMTLTSATLGDISVSLYSRGTDGTAARTLVQSISATSVTIGNSGFNQSTFFAGFGGGNNSGTNIAAFDNFSVTAIPEPSAFAALAGLGALGFASSRRRRRA